LTPRMSELESQIVSFDGTGRYVYSMSSVIRTAKGFLLATNFFDVTERKRMEELLRLQRDLGLSLAATRDPVAAAQQVLSAVCKVDSIDSGGFYTVDSETGTVDLIAHHKLSPLFIENTAHYSADSPNAQIVKAGKALYEEQQNLGAQTKVHLDKEGLRALAMIPIQHEGQSIALLSLASHTNDSIPTNTRLALESIAAQVGSTLARIRAEYALSESQRDLQTLFDTVDEFLLIVDHDGKILKTNSAVQKRLGYSVPALSQMTILDVHPPEQRDEVARIVTAMLKGEQNVCAVPFMTRERQRIAVETKVTSGQWGKQAVLFGFSRDVTDRKQAEDALRESEERYRSLFEKNAAVKLIIDTDTSAIIEVNNAAIEFYGYSREQFKSLHLRDINRLPDETILADLELVRNERRGLFVRKHRLANGETRDVQVFTGSVDIRGKNYLNSIVIDVTAQHRAEEALRESEERLRLIMENSQEGILLMDEQTQVIMANPAACRIFGRSEAEMLASRRGDLFDEADIRFRHFIEEVNRTGYGQSELTGFRPEHTSFPLEISVGVFTGRDGRQLRSGTARDISERQRYQQTLVEQERLRTALAKETELSQLKTHMMERVAHEFRTPLSVILASAESLDVYRDRLTEEQKAKKFKNIYERVHHITDFLQQISLVITGELVPDNVHFKPTNLSALCRQTALELETQFEQPGRYNLDLPDSVMVSADSTALKNAVFHVMRNAAQFSAPTNSVKVTLSMSDRGIELAVSDSGIGILPEDQERIFEAFFRGANIGMVGGLGLGLTIAKACVELHGGTITVESIPRQGTTVHIWLPLVAS